MSCIVKVNYSPEGRCEDRGLPFAIIETACADFEQVCEAVTEGRPLFGDRLFTRRDGDAQVILRRAPILVMPVAIATVELPNNWRYVEEVE